MPLHLKYRPQNLNQFYGNESLAASLQSILQRADRPRAFMFTGPSGCGKTTLARIVAQEIGCNMDESMGDYYEKNVSDARGIDDARKMIQEMWYMPSGGQMKVYCLDEVQGATSAFQESILKALEDTPKHVTFILCTTDPQKLKKTIKNRCSQFEVRPLPGPIMKDFLSSILTSEFGDDSNLFPEDFYTAVIEAAEGCPRRALVILDQVIDLGNIDLMVEAVKRTQVGEADLRTLMNHLLRKSPWKQVAKVITDLEAQGQDWEQLRISVMTWACKVLISEGVPQSAVIIDFFKEPLFNAGKAGFVLACYRCSKCTQ